jgi:E3 ubiquitin-protein ligase AIP2
LPFKEKDTIHDDNDRAFHRENIVVGDTVQRMPCSHVFHPPCLAPWLEQHNSCPVCRHELPTDDWRYDTRKEREKEHDEEEAGRNNAISHSEFLYV